MIDEPIVLVLQLAQALQTGNTGAAQTATANANSAAANGGKICSSPLHLAINGTAVHSLSCP